MLTDDRNVGELTGDTGFDKKCGIIILVSLIISSIPGMLYFFNLI